MSTQVYPDLIGLGFGVKRTPTWNTDIRTTPSRREYRSTDQVYSLRKRTLIYEFLRSREAYAELQSLEGHFNQHKGALDSFLFSDPDDQTVTAQAIGVGDASNTDFQLARTWGGVVEPVARANGAIQVYKNGVLQTLTTHYTLVNGSIFPNDPSLIRFVTAPGSGVVVTWTGSYYWRCRFNKDELDFEKFLYKLWKTGTVELFDTRT